MLESICAGFKQCPSVDQVKTGIAAAVGAVRKPIALIRCFSDKKRDQQNLFCGNNSVAIPINIPEAPPKSTMTRARDGEYA